MSQTIPIMVIIATLLLTGVCSCIGLNRKFTCAGICSIVLAGVLFGVIMLIGNLAFEYFDFKKGCSELAKVNPFIELFIDKNLDSYF